MFGSKQSIEHKDSFNTDKSYGVEANSNPNSSGTQAVTRPAGAKPPPIESYPDPDAAEKLK